MTCPAARIEATYFTALESPERPLDTLCAPLWFRLRTLLVSLGVTASLFWPSRFC